MGLFSFLKPKPKLSSEVEKAMQQIDQLAFPAGRCQVEEETEQLYGLLHGKLSKHDAMGLLTRTKALLIIAKDKSERRIVSSIFASMKGKLTEHEARLVYIFLIGVIDPSVLGGDGSSSDKAVVINATSSIIGIIEEYDYIRRVCGTNGYTLKSQMKASLNGRDYDVMNVILKDGAERTFWFDITSFFGKA